MFPLVNVSIGPSITGLTGLDLNTYLYVALFTGMYSYPPNLTGLEIYYTGM
jgi:hypothetical protein